MEISKDFLKIITAAHMMGSSILIKGRAGDEENGYWIDLPEWTNSGNDILHIVADVLDGKGDLYNGLQVTIDDESDFVTEKLKEIGCQEVFDAWVAGEEIICSGDMVLRSYQDMLEETCPAYYFLYQLDEIPKVLEKPKVPHALWMDIPSYIGEDATKDGTGIKSPATATVRSAWIEVGKFPESHSGNNWVVTNMIQNF